MSEVKTFGTTTPELLKLGDWLTEHRPAETNRVQKLLELANIKLGNVATDVLGASGRAMLEALMAGERDGEKLARLAKGKLKRKRAALGPALTGRFTQHHEFLLRQLLTHIDELDEHIAQCDRKVDEDLRPFGQEAELLQP